MPVLENLMNEEKKTEKRHEFEETRRRKGIQALLTNVRRGHVVEVDVNINMLSGKEGCKGFFLEEGKIVLMITFGFALTLSLMVQSIEAFSILWPPKPQRQNAR